MIAGVWLAVTGLVAFLLSRGLQKSREKKTNVDNRQTALVVEGILTVLLVAAGIVLRLSLIHICFTVWRLPRMQERLYVKNRENFI